jgi:hypothetical protein
LNKLTLIQKFLFYTTLLAELLPLIFCILFYKKLNTKALKVFFYYALTLFIFAGLTYLARLVISDSKLFFFLLRVFSICEYTIISFFLYNIFVTKIAKKIALFSIAPFVLYAILDYIFSDKNQFNNHSNIVSSLLLISFIIYFFYEKMNTVVMYPLYQSITFWICVGLFLYFAGSFFFFIFIKSGADKEFVLLMNSIYAIVVVTKNIFLSLALFASEKTNDNDDGLFLPIDLDLDELSLTNPKNL